MSFGLNDTVRIIDIDAVGTIVKILDNSNYLVTYYNGTNVDLVTSESNLELKSGMDLVEYEMDRRAALRPNKIPPPTPDKSVVRCFDLSQTDRQFESAFKLIERD